jgi:hypothetical protein
LLAKLLLVAIKPVRSIVSPLANLLIPGVPRPLAASSPATIHSVLESNAGEVKLVMLRRWS